MTQSENQIAAKLSKAELTNGATHAASGVCCGPDNAGVASELLIVGRNLWARQWHFDCRIWGMGRHIP